MKPILITRPRESAEALAERLCGEGFDARPAPLIEYSETGQGLPDLAHYQALAFTSAEGLRVFAKRTEARSLPVFCVGDSTAQAASQAGFVDIHSAQGDGAALSDLICARKGPLELKKILHVCGEDTAHDLNDALSHAGITAERLVVYKANLLDRLPLRAEEALESGEGATVLLFSARAAGRMDEILRQQKFAGASARLDALCISGRVAAALDGPAWKTVRVAGSPTLESMLELLHEKEEEEEHADESFSALKADPVIEAFGGLRPLANRLGITASTVQGWKKRGLIPASRIDAILAAASEKGIDADQLLQECAVNDKTPDNKDANDPQAPRPGFSERRAGADRRVRRTPPDEKGHIRTETYTGADRRTGNERRSYQERQRQKIWREKMNFVNRTTISAAFFTAALAYAVWFLLAPEISRMNEDAARVKQMEEQMAVLNRHIAQLQEEKKNASLSAVVSRKIGDIQEAAETAKEAAENAGSAAAEAAKPLETGAVEELVGMLNGMQGMVGSEEGREALAAAAAKLRSALAVAERDPKSMNDAIAVARAQDPTLQTLLGGVDRRNLSAAALLLALNELRSHIDGQQPFADDLALVSRFAGRDPGMHAALMRLAPYAASGVLSRDTLQQQFKGLAYDIVTAKLAGEDVSVKDAALRRLSHFVKIRRVDDIEGDSVDAKVARAQLNVDKGDLRGALTQLQGLEGAPAEAAQPWMEQAAGTVIAEDSSAILSQAIIRLLSSSTEEEEVSIDGMISSLRDSFAPLSEDSVYLSPDQPQDDAVYPFLAQ